VRIRSSQISSYFGIAGLSAYLLLAVVARIAFPSSFTPINNWLSDLGHRLLNPNGAIYYRLSGIVGGACLIVFFAFARIFTDSCKRPVLLLSALVKALGILAATCFILTGIYSEDMMPMHSWFSMANFILFGTAIALTCVMNLIAKTLPIWFTVICLIGWTADIVSGFFGNVRWLEWVVVASLIAFVGSLSVFGIVQKKVP